eukprot:TRINITY_DN23455_c0_g1_i1.p2 TRINITY_DN23455_c0_g1~~TRINITY_DN23455_c0_g1_i1.p2  ORF type:complete len:126 (+),score=17.37 TRINITY_DN23455_c0_g1_i1:69-446(+)
MVSWCVFRWWYLGMIVVGSLFYFFFFFKQKTAYEMQRGLVGSEMCIRDSFFLVSAKTGSCVDELFRNLVQKILTQLDLSLTIRNSVKLDKNPKGAFQLTSSTKETKSKKCSCQLQPSSQPTTMSE